MEKFDLDNALGQESSVNKIEKRDEFAKSILSSLIKNQGVVDSQELKEMIDMSYTGADQMLVRRKTL